MPLSLSVFRPNWIPANLISSCLNCAGTKAPFHLFNKTLFSIFGPAFSPSSLIFVDSHAKLLRINIYFWQHSISACICSFFAPLVGVVVGLMCNSFQSNESGHKTRFRKCRIMSHSTGEAVRKREIEGKNIQIEFIPSGNITQYWTRWFTRDTSCRRMFNPCGFSYASSSRKFR